MSFQLYNSKKVKKSEDQRSEGAAARETDPLLRESRSGGFVRSRRSTSGSPVGSHQGRTMIDHDDEEAGDHPHDGYESLDDHTMQSAPPPQNALHDEESLMYNPTDSSESPPPRNQMPIHHVGGNIPPEIQSAASGVSVGSVSHQPVLEIPEEVYAVRKAALKVLKPLTRTWIVVSVGFALSVLFGMSRWTRLLPGLPFWFILLPAWSAHVGLLWLHILSAQALSTFIAEANDSRQRPDSRDHLNRTEYLPLLQRSLKFGLKTGLLSFCMFLFETLVYIRLSRGTVSMSGAMFPLWLLIIGGILNGIICKSQDFLRVLCWVLAFASMIMLAMKIDYGVDSIRWRIAASPLVGVLVIASASLAYIVCGHQIGYYRLTDPQLTAGTLYSLASLLCIVLVVVISEVIPLNRPVEVETRLLVVIVAPVVVCLVGMGAWVVSRDEFARLLLFGGQSAVHPLKLRWESNGWSTVQGHGVSVIPMFGEVDFHPLDAKLGQQGSLLFRLFLNLYPHEDLIEEDESSMFLSMDVRRHPYLDAASTSDRSGAQTA